MGQRSALMVAGAVVLFASGCAGNHPAPTMDQAAGGAGADRPKTIGITVHSDFSVDLARPEVSKKRGDKVHWSLEGGTGRLEIEPKEAANEWPGALDVKCAGSECWGKIKATARTNTSHEYRVVIDGKP